jgi:hypothetical protein
MAAWERQGSAGTGLVAPAKQLVDGARAIAAVMGRCRISMQHKRRRARTSGRASIARLNEWEVLGWLGNLDSNQDKQSQSLLCYRYTIPQGLFSQFNGLRNRPQLRRRRRSRPIGWPPFYSFAAALGKGEADPRDRVACSGCAALLAGIVLGLRSFRR